MKPILERAIAAMRNTEVQPEELKQAAERVLVKLKEEHNKVVPYPAVVDRITSCADFQSLIPAYLSRSLTASRTMLLEDHTRECLDCRKALGAARYRPVAAFQASPASASRSRKRTSYRAAAVGAVAAALLVGVGLSEINAIRNFLWPIEVHATVQTVDGSLFMVSGPEIHTIAAGDRIDRDRVVRTGKDSAAVLELADGSRIEMWERSELSLGRGRDGVKVRLDRGSVIVTAAKQRTGHLYVATDDLTVSVVGTVFSVNAGANGSRVSVIEGEVRVEHGLSSDALRPGQQFVSNPVLHKVNQDRRTSNLLNLVPENTAIFASLPNDTESLMQSYEAFKQRISERPDFQTSVGQDKLDDMMGRVRQVGSLLGPEVILVVPDRLEKESGPVLFAETSQPTALQAAIAGFPAGGLTFAVDGGLFLVSPSARGIQSILALRRHPGSNPFLSSRFYSRIASAYEEGVSWLFAADLPRLIPVRPATTQLGLADAQQFIIQQKTGPGGESYRAVLGFSQARRGIMGWLAEPAPMGALEFVSPGAYGVAAFAMKDPALILEDVLGLVGSNNSAAIGQLEDFEREHNIDIRHDLAAPLGGEFLFALDGPILPEPSWKIVAEVYDSARLQNTIQWAISQNDRNVGLSTETVNGHTFYTVTSKASPYKIHYTFWSGYLLIGPSQTLLTEAMRYHDGGESLARSANFRSQLLAEGRDYVSGFIYQNFARNAEPSLISLYGEQDRIVLSSKGTIGMNIANMGGLGSLLEQLRSR